MRPKHRSIGAFAILALSSTLLASSLGAQGEAKQGAAPGAQPPQPSAEELAMQAAWEKAATPGPEHAQLAAMAGSWEFTGSFRMQPDGEPTTSTGTAERSMILGGRVMLEKVTSEMFGSPFEGFGLMGFDNISREWWGTWNDNMGTGLMTSTGKCTATSCEFTGTFVDALTGKPKTMRMTSTHEPDREAHKMYDVTPDGREWVSVELVYTRKK